MFIPWSMSVDGVPDDCRRLDNCNLIQAYRIKLPGIWIVMHFPRQAKVNTPPAPGRAEAGPTRVPPRLLLSGAWEPPCRHSPPVLTCLCHPQLHHSPPLAVPRLSLPVAARPVISADVTPPSSTPSLSRSCPLGVLGPLGVDLSTAFLIGPHHPPNSTGTHKAAD